MLVGAAVTLALGCGGGGDRATARSTPTPTPTEPPAAPPAPAAGPAARPGLRLQRVGTFHDPLYVTAPPGDRRRIFVVEQGGRVLVVRDGRKMDRPFLDVSDRISVGRRARTAVARVRARLRLQRPLLRLLHGA